MKKTIIISLAMVVACSAFAARPKTKKKGECPLELPKNTKIFQVGGTSPIKTIEDAIERVANWREGNTKVPIGICIAPGDYAPAHQLTIKPSFASTEMAPLYIYAEDFNNKPRIHGGAFVTDWKKITFNGRKDVWVADISKLQAPEDFTKLRLVYNGRRLHPARWPNFDPDEPYTSGYTLVSTTNEPPLYADEIKIFPEDVRKWEHPEDAIVRICTKHSYGFSRARVLSVENGTTIRIKRQHVEIKKGDRYERWCVQNMAEELDEPGEWYYNPREKKVYLLTPDGGDPNKTAVAFGRWNPVFRVSKKSGNVTFAGLEIVGGENGIRVAETEDVSILGCSIHDCGMAVWNAGLRTQIRDNDIFHTDGIAMLIHSRWGDRMTDHRQGVVVENNYFHHTGEIGSGSAALFNAGQGVRISHNLFHDVPRTAISGYGRFCDISYNRVRHTNLMSCDGGALYDSGWTQGAGSTIRYNWISDAIGLRRVGVGVYRHRTDACGIYFDECSGGTTVYGNHVENCNWTGIMLHNARWLTVSNNVFISNGWRPVWHYTHQVEISSWEKKGFQTPKRRKIYMDGWNSLVKHDKRWRELPSLAQNPYTDEVFSSDNSMVMGNKFVHNIFYYPDQCHGVLLYGHQVNMSTNLFDRNLYWTGKSKILRSATRVYKKEDTSWEAWLKVKKQDKNSRIANPQFRNPEKGDYRLKSSSPAFKLGFEEIPYDEIGLKVTKFRPKLPVEAEGVREHPEWLTDSKGRYNNKKKKGKGQLRRGGNQRLQLRNKSFNVRN